MHSCIDYTLHSVRLRLRELYCIDFMVLHIIVCSCTVYLHTYLLSLSHRLKGDPKQSIATAVSMRKGILKE